MTSTFELRLLGTPTVLDSQGVSVDLPLGKPLAALCYVALESSRVTREDLGNILWARSSPDRQRASVRQALWLLRKAAGDELLVEDERGLRVDDGRVSLDLDRFEDRLAPADLVEAWRMWEGGPLRAFAIPDAPRWNAWADRIRGTWERRFGEALEVRAAAEDGEARITWLRRALEVRPFRESAHAALVEAYIHQRRPDEAESALHEARTVVDEPTPSLFSELEARLRSIRKRSFDGGEERLRFEFVGRAPEFTALTSLWRSVLSGRPRTGVVLGPAGIGKTRLVEEFLELALADGAHAAGVKGIDAERAIELGSLALLVKELLTLPGAAGISSGSLNALHALVPSAVRGGDTPAATPGRAALGDALLDLVEAVAHEGPLILRLEDLHWIDPASRDLVFRTVRHLRNARVLLVATCRSEDADASVLRRLRSLRDERALEEIRLGPLTRGEVGELLGLTFDFPDDAVADAAAACLYRASGGNPLFLVELLLGLRGEGLIRESDEVGRGWVMVGLPGPESLTLPRTLREALRARLADLSDPARTLGAVLAGADGGLTPGELVGRAGLGESRGTDAVGELLRRDVARWDRQHRLQVAHDSMREFLRPEAAHSDRRAKGGLGKVAMGVAGLAAVAVLFVLAPGWLEVGAASGEAPFGGGTLFVDFREEMVGYRFRIGPEGEIRMEATDTLWGEPGLGFSGPPYRAGTGEWWVPLSGSRDPELAPDAWLATPDSTWRVYRTPGDDNLRQVAPDGRHLLLTVQDPDTTWFRMNLVRLDTETGDTTVVLGSATGFWSADGSRIFAAKRAVGGDTLVALRPDGQRLASAPMPHGRGSLETWCAEAGVVLGSSLPPARGPEVWAWRPEEDGVAPEPVPLPVPSVRSHTCSPRGREVAYIGRVGGGTALVVHDLLGGGTHMFEEPPRTNRLRWVEDRPSVVPREVDLIPERLALVRGERAAIAYEVVGVREPLPAARRSWSSSDPLVAVVTADEEVVGNGPGEAWVRLAVDGWLTDSVLVSVAERGDAGGPVFSDRMAALDTGVWYALGHPTPVSETLEDGQVVLSMEGDGRSTDGIVTRRRFAVGRGAALEVDFRLPLTKVDQQSVELCLLDAEPVAGPRGWELGRLGEEVCFRWPADELERFDPGEATFDATRVPMGPVRVDDLIRSDGWNRASIRLRPDGTATLFLNETFVATLPDRIPLEAGDLWRLAVFGRAADTKLHVRNLVLWGEARAGAPAG